MRGYLAMTRSEFRLFRREPFSLVFALAFPLMMMMLLAVVFGSKQADARKLQNGMLVWRGVTPSNYYTALNVPAIPRCASITKKAGVAGRRCVDGHCVKTIPMMRPTATRTAAVGMRSTRELWPPLIMAELYD